MTVLIIYFPLIINEFLRKFNRFNNSNFKNTNSRYTEEKNKRKLQLAMKEKSTEKK